MAPVPEQSLEQQVRSVVAAHRGERGALLPILHGIQSELGHVDPAVIPILADELNLSRAEVYGVVTFYHDFRQTPPGRTTVRICRAEACQAVGAAALADHAQARLGLSFGETSADGAVTLEQAFCFGNCALGPAVQVGDRLHGRVDPARLDSLLEANW
ncbi:MAG TPA: formate dehydrogenase subunit gamma [Planosporangium sp.]|jgi:formate dehydrogenase subunit gamma|nr:formate dehydrogenase subunit gamma [Planosporangium sp.]